MFFKKCFHFLSQSAKWVIMGTVPLITVQLVKESSVVA